MAGTASTATVFSPAQSSAAPQPAPNHSSAYATDPETTPIGPTASEQAQAAMVADRAAPIRSEARPAARPSTMPASPNAASSSPRAVEPIPNASTDRSETRNPSPVIPT